MNGSSGNVVITVDMVMWIYIYIWPPPRRSTSAGILPPTARGPAMKLTTPVPWIATVSPLQVFVSCCREPPVCCASRKILFNPLLAVTRLTPVASPPACSRQPYLTDHRVRGRTPTAVLTLPPTGVQQRSPRPLSVAVGLRPFSIEGRHIVVAKCVDFTHSLHSTTCAADNPTFLR